MADENESPSPPATSSPGDKIDQERTQNKSTSPGPPPDGGLTAWLQGLGGWLLNFNRWYFDIIWNFLVKLYRRTPHWNLTISHLMDRLHAGIFDADRGYALRSCDRRWLLLRQHYRRSIPSIIWHDDGVDLHESLAIYAGSGNRGWHRLRLHFHTQRCDCGDIFFKKSFMGTRHFFDWKFCR